MTGGATVRFPSSTAQTQRPKRRTLVVAVVIAAIAVTTAFGGYYVSEPRGNRTPSVVDDGPTLYQALTHVNSSALVVPGGPWTLSQVFGVASPVPVDPSSWGWGQYDDVLTSCQAAFNGLTIWNGTIPLFTGTFNSGTAPFWQIVYFSNSSQQLLVGTDVNGVVHTFPPISMTSECAERSGLAFEPWVWSEFWSQYGYPADSPTIASNDWNFMAGHYVAWLNRPVAELYLFGTLQFGSGQGGVPQINFFTCGTVGAVGSTPGLALYGGPDGVLPPGSFATSNYTLGCTPTDNNWNAIPLQLNFSNASLHQYANSQVARQLFQFNMTGSPPLFAGPGYNLRGMTSWMIDLNLTSPGGRTLPLSGSECSSWVTLVSDCTANASGWYAVLLAPDGAWLGSYGATANGPEWSYPVLPFANNETIAVVVPSSWNVTGDTLGVTSTTSDLPLTGSVTI